MPEELQRDGDGRHFSFWGATGVGVGAIVGGGILALAGAAYAATGGGAVLAFALNGVIALLTVFSFAELGSRFPLSGGPYAFAKRVYAVEAAFAMGWIVWFAALVAAALYAIGFGEFLFLLVAEALGDAAPAWVGSRPAVVTVAVLATAFYCLLLCLKSENSGQWTTIGKTVLFGFLVLAGTWVFLTRSPGQSLARLRPLFPNGAGGFFRAMGFTFIALQGFDLIASVAGEVRNPRRVLPRAMFTSLGIALALYLPLLLLIPAVGIDPETTVAAVAAANPESAIAIGVRGFIGPAGYSIVLVAGVLAMLSALQAYLLAASRVAQAMGQDHTLPLMVGSMSVERGTPQHALVLSAALILAVILFVPNVALAGAAASLVFLIAFTLVHWTAWLARRRVAPAPDVFQSPWFPVIPLVGCASCLALALFQGRAVPTAGKLVVAWLGIGGLLYFSLFSRRARIQDATSEAINPEITRLRGKSPLVLVPVINPDHAPAMVEVATALAPPVVGRVLLLSVVSPPGPGDAEATASRLANAQQILHGILSTSFAAGLAPDAMTTISSRPWEAIDRVARRHRCESLLVGFSHLPEQTVSGLLEDLVSHSLSDVAILRSTPGWRFADVRRVLVPIGGRSRHEQLRARLIGSLIRAGVRDVTFLRVLPERVPDRLRRNIAHETRAFLEAENAASCEIRVVRDDHVADAVAREASDCDLVILGIQRHGRRRKIFGQVTLDIGRKTSCALLMLSGRG